MATSTSTSSASSNEEHTLRDHYPNPEENEKLPGLHFSQGKEPVFEPIKTGSAQNNRTQSDDIYRYPSNNREELNEIAQYLSRTQTNQTKSPRDGEETSDTTLGRTDTVAAMELNDPRFDPSKADFDFYLWVRKFLRLMEENDIKPRRAGFVFKSLNISGVGNALQLQSDVSAPLLAPFRFREHFSSASEKRILRNFNGAVRPGEMLIVLGRPGSGCSTFLKSICGVLYGLNMAKGSVIHYDGIEQDQFKKEFRGEVIYNQENEKHFPHLTVGETLEFAAAARTPSARVKDAPRKDSSKYMARVVMNIFGLSHTRNTKVGNDFVRGVSGGERKRVSIAEMALAGSPIAAWDNSTRGLDAATALEFVRSLRNASNLAGMTQAVAIYQASQSIYDQFDKAIVLYEGRQIYFGPVDRAKAYFENMGWACPQRQTTGDFLTSVTNPPGT